MFFLYIYFFHKVNNIITSHNKYMNELHLNLLFCLIYTLKIFVFSFFIKKYIIKNFIS